VLGLEGGGSIAIIGFLRSMILCAFILLGDGETKGYVHYVNVYFYVGI
jgi:hypothetical protein